MSRDKLIGENPTQTELIIFVFLTGVLLLCFDNYRESVIIRYRSHSFHIRDNRGDYYKDTVFKITLQLYRKIRRSPTSHLSLPNIS